MNLSGDLKLRESRIVSQQPIGTEAKLLSLPRLEKFESGQSIGISLDPRGEIRWYSLCSAPHEDKVQILYTKVEQGYLTPRLWDAGPGTPLWIAGARGSFFDPEMSAVSAQKSAKVRKQRVAVGADTAKNDAGPVRVWWICNGTGIAPFVSMIRDCEEKKKTELLERRFLVHGARNLADAYFSEELEAAARKYGLRCVHCLSGDSEALPGPQAAGTKAEWLPGRLTLWEGLSEISPADRVMLCGSSGMINDLRFILLENGFPFERIAAEVYF